MVFLAIFRGRGVAGLIITHRFPNHSKTRLKKSRKQLFWTNNCSKMTLSNDQNGSKIDQKILPLELKIRTKHWKKQHLWKLHVLYGNFNVHPICHPPWLYRVSEPPLISSDICGFSDAKKKKKVSIHKYIVKNCFQHSYGFQNFMSSWGSWSKNSKLQLVGDFSFFTLKIRFYKV